MGCVVFGGFCVFPLLYAHGDFLIWVHLYGCLLLPILGCCQLWVVSDLILFALPLHMVIVLRICRLDSSGLITFASRSEVSVQLRVFGMVMVSSPVFRELRGVWRLGFWVWWVDPFCFEIGSQFLEVYYLNLLWCPLWQTGGRSVVKVFDGISDKFHYGGLFGLNGGNRRCLIIFWRFSCD